MIFVSVRSSVTQQIYHVEEVEVGCEEEVPLNLFPMWPIV